MKTKKTSKSWFMTYLGQQQELLPRVAMIGPVGQKLFQAAIDAGPQEGLHENRDMVASKIGVVLASLMIITWHKGGFWAALPGPDDVLTWNLIRWAANDLATGEVLDGTTGPNEQFKFVTHPRNTGLVKALADVPAGFLNCVELDPSPLSADSELLDDLLCDDPFRRTLIEAQKVVIDTTPDDSHTEMRMVPLSSRTLADILKEERGNRK